MMSMKELCTRFSGVFIQNLSRSLEPSSRILNASPVTIFGVAHRSQTPLALRKNSRTPFIIFSGEKRGDVIKANPGIKIPDLGRKLGQMWRSLTDENKEVYFRRYKDEKEEFLAKRNAELDGMTEDEKQQLLDQKQEIKNKKIVRKEKKVLKELMKPKPSDVNPFVLFYKSNQSKRGDTPISTFLKNQSDQWNSLKDEQRKPFVDQAKLNSARYQDELKRWEKKMFTQGNANVLSPRVVGKLTRQQTGRTAKKSKSASTKTRKPRAKAAAASTTATPRKPTPAKPKV